MRYLATLCAAALIGSLATAPAPALEPGGPVPVADDLLAVLKLRGRACDAIASHRRIGEADYEVVCRDGHRYRIRVGPDQRVVVEESR